MFITKEHYRNFIDTLFVERAKLNKEIKALNSSNADYYEIKNCINQFDHFTSVQTYFMESDRWASFESLELLQTYVEVIKHNYQSMEEYSKSVLPKDGGELIGVTPKEWDELEIMRYELRERMAAWVEFLNFCKGGIL